jgi:hypothetical protein
MYEESRDAEGRTRLAVMGEMVRDLERLGHNVRDICSRLDDCGMREAHKAIAAISGPVDTLADQLRGEAARWGLKRESKVGGQ